MNSIGFLTVYRIGDVAVRAKYQDLDGFATMQGVVPGGLSYYYRALSGWVRDGQTNCTLPGATILQPGTFTVRFSRAGYVRTDLTFTLPGDKLLSLDATLPRSP